MLNAVRQTPRFAQPGGKGTEMRVGLELQIIADIGLVGFPNAGKSSLINLFTNARSKVAGYPFTTKIPVLGVLREGDQDVVIADIPGIIEGASEGSGMGYKFLRHISRTKGLCYLVDLSDDNYLTAYDTLSAELSKYSEELASKEHIIVGTKIDEDGTEERFEELKAKYSDTVVLPLSIYRDDLMPDLKKNLLRLSGEKKEDGFTSRMDTDAHYRDEA